MKTLRLTLSFMLALWLMAHTAGAYNLWIAGTQVTDANKDDLSVIDGVSGSVSYDPTTTTLTLTNATITGAGEMEAALKTGLATIVVKVNGTCTIDGGSDKYGWYINSTKITLEGESRLEVKGSTAIFMNNPSDKITVNGPTLVAEGVAADGCGIRGRNHSGTHYFGNLDVQAGNVRAQGAGGSIIELNTLTMSTGYGITDKTNFDITFSEESHRVEYAGEALNNWVYILDAEQLAEAEMMNTPMTLEAVSETATVTISGIPTGGVNALMYRLDGTPHTIFDRTTYTIKVPAGSKLEFSSSLSGTQIQCYYADCYIYGNIMYGFQNEAVLKDTGVFKGLFSGNTHIVNHPTKLLVLPATTLSEECYKEMFEGCTGLTKAPNLPATELAKSCYESMFEGCTGLTKAPTLPAKVLAESCYKSMFDCCTGLTEAPTLPATKLTERCYSNMFFRCTGLTKAPELPALELEKECYYCMFFECTGLTESPVLVAPILVERCYQGMFNTCTNLNKVTCLAQDISASFSTHIWLDDVSATGEFISPNYSDWPTGISGIPEGWTQTIDYSKAAKVSYPVKSHTFTFGDDLSLLPELSNPNNLSIIYKSSDPSVATIDNDGKVTVLKMGTTTISASSLPTADHYAGYAEYTLTALSAELTPVVKFECKNIIYTLGTEFPQPKLTLSEGLTPTYVIKGISGTPTIDSNTGAVTINTEGVYKVTVTTPYTEWYLAGSDCYYITALKAADVSNAKGDVNHDGIVDSQDASLIQQKVAGKISW